MTTAATPFPVDEARTAITIAYRNQAYIADDVLPRVGVDGQVFRYNSWPESETFLLPEAQVGRRSQPNMIDLSATETPAQTVDFALDDAVPQNDIISAQAQRRRYDPVDRSTEQLTDYIMLAREKRVADLVFALGSYPTGNKATLSGNDQWSDYTNSKPVEAILTALDACLMRPNVMVIGQAAWTKLRQHPKVVGAALGNAGTSGVVTRQQMAEILELEEVLVGQGWLNTARKGQAATMTRVWGKSAALIYRNRLATNEAGMSFGFTAEWGGRIASTWFEQKLGARGSTMVRVGESVKELVVAGRAGYLFDAAVA